MKSPNTALLMDLYELTMAECYFRYKPRTQATFDLFVRDFPENRCYFVFAGLENIINYVKGLRFRRDDLLYLRNTRFFSYGFLEYLSRFRFKGDIWAFRKDEIYFPKEIIVHSLF